MKFNCKESALAYLRQQSFLKELPNNSFVYGPNFELKDNEAGSPYFYPTRYKGGWYIKVIHRYRLGRFNKRPDGKCFFKGMCYLVNNAM